MEDEGGKGRNFVKFEQKHNSDKKFDTNRLSSDDYSYHNNNWYAELSKFHKILEHKQI